MQIMRNMDILYIGERARNKRNSGVKIIDGSIGCLLKDDKSLKTYDLINNAIKEKFPKYLVYPSPTGSPAYQDAVQKWVLGDYLSPIASRCVISFSATVGGSGAVSDAFRYIRDEKGCVVITDVNWPNYFTILGINEVPYKKYQRFRDDGSFNFEALDTTIEATLKEYPCAMVVLNDPCHNPTGYCFKESEYETLFKILDKYNGKAMLLLDMAYADYAPMGFMFPRLYEEHKETFTTFIAFSTSKCFGLYGMRLGGVIVLSNKDVTHSLYEYARSIYSCPNNGAMGPVAELLANDELRLQLKAEIQSENDRLKEVGYKVTEILDELGIEHFPYSGGFFVTMKCKNAYATCETLEDNNCFLAPIGDDYIRIAVCSLRFDELDGLKEALKSIK